MLFIMTPSTSRSNTFILLFYLLFPFAHMSCPIQCPGRKVEDCKCTSPCYRELRQGIQTCQRCTEMCSARKNQIEVRPCTREMNRLCNCKPGYYCRKSYNYGTYCHEPCVRCEPGTFSSKPSLDPVCKPHKDCAQLGMETLKKGTETQDSECAFVTSTMAASSSPSSNINSIYTNTTSTLRTVKNIRSLVAESTATPDRESVNATTKMAPTASSNFTTVYTHTASTLRTVKEIVTRGSSVEGSTATPDSQSVNATTKMTASPTASSHFNTVYTHTASTLRTVKEIVTRGSSVEESTATPDRESVNATTKMAASPTASSHFNTVYTHTASTLRTEGTPLSIDQEKSESHWPLLLILLLLLLFMAGFCMLMKGKTLKTLCFGLIKGEHEERLHWRKRAGEHQILSNSQSNVLIDHNMKTEIPLGSDVREVKGQSMDMTPQSGVVQQVTVEHNGRGENVSNTVGSIYIYSPGMVILGSNSGDKKEEVGVCEEARPLIGAPQQESNPPSQEVKIRLSAQEEAEEELSLSFPVPATGK